MSVAVTAVWRVAGTWSSAGTPPPVATHTNVADGPLNTSLAESIAFRCGASYDGQTLFFFDDGLGAADGIFDPQLGNLLRRLATCAPPGGGWHIGQIAWAPA